jgi:hypothetical protein
MINLLCIFDHMKKVIGILALFLLSTAFCCPGALTHNALHVFHPIECQGSSSSVLTDLCEEGMTTNENGTSFHMTTTDYLPGGICPHISLGINSFVWQPPE